MRTTHRLIAAALIPCSLAACDRVDFGNLHVASVTRIEKLDEQSPKGELEGYMDNPAYPGKPELLRIDLETDTDIGRQVNEEHHATVDVEVRVCSGAHQGPVSNWPGVFYREVSIGKYTSTDAEQANYRRMTATAQGKRLIYSVYLRVRDIPRAEPSPDLPDRVAYDLASEPEDLCIRVGAGGVFWRSTSSIIAVSKALVAAAARK